MNKSTILILLLGLCYWNMKAQVGLICGESITVTEVDSMDFIIPDGATSLYFNLRGGDGGRLRLSGLSCDITRNGGEAATVIAEYEIGLAPNQLKAGGLIRIYSGFSGGYYGTICAPPNPNVSTSGGGATGVLYLPPGSNTNDEWYLLAVAGGGGGVARPIAGLFREGRGGNASELGSNYEGNLVGFNGHCGKANLVGINGAFTGVGNPGGGIFCGDSGDEPAANSVVDSAYYDNNDNLLIKLKELEYSYSTGGCGFTGGGYHNGQRGAGGGGGFSGGSTRSNYAGGGGGSYVNEYFANLVISKFDGEDGGSHLRNGQVIIDTKGASRNQAVCQNATVSKDVYGDYILYPSDIDGGSFGNCYEELIITFDNDTYSRILDCSSLVQTVTLKVTSATGDISTCDATVTLLDDTNPSVSCKNATLYLDNNGLAQLTQANVVSNTTDDCGIQGIGLSKTQFNCNDLGTNNVTVILSDQAGNNDTCYANVTVIDTIAPVYNQNVADTLYFTCGGTLIDQPTATDNCGNGIGGTTDDPLSYSAQGTYTVTWEYEDASGNKSTSTQTVIVDSGVIYVDGDAVAGQQTGDSWQDAYSTLQQALDAASSCGGNAEIWVADGIYIPSQRVEGLIFGGSLARQNVFYIDRDGTQLYGGFSGLNGAQETSREQRNPDLNITILEGDRGAVGVASDNCYRVLYMDGTTTNGVLSSSTIVDGFTIQNGNADFFGANSGAGLYIAGNLSSSPTEPIINNCRFVNNNASFAGAGIYLAGFNGNASPTITNCIFSNNTATSFGAAIHFDFGFGIASPNIQNCVFEDNTVTSGDGAISIIASGFQEMITSFINCVFDNNSPNHIKYDETEGEQGANTIELDFINCTFYGATGNAIQIDNIESDPIDFLNCIFWNNTLISNNTTAVAPQFCIVGDDTNSDFTGINGNFDQNPLFTNTILGDLSLSLASPAIDAGEDSFAAGISTDILENGRFLGCSIDIGAYEYQTTTINSPILYVDQSVTSGTNDGSSWANAFTDLQDAINAFSIDCNEEIWVAGGIYTPTDDNPTSIDETARDVTFYINKEGIKIYGGFNGTETARSQRLITTNKTILSGDLFGDDAANLSGTDLVNDNTRNDNAFHVVLIDGTIGNGMITAATILDGFYIEDGNADANGDSSNNTSIIKGGGIYNEGIGAEASPSIVNCFFQNNSALDGGAIYNNGGASGQSDPTLRNCTFTNNAASANGGAMVNNASNSGTSNPNLINCLFYDNTADTGGAINNRGDNGGSSTPNIINCTFYANSASSTGGAIGNADTNPDIENCIFWENEQNSATNIAGADINDDANSASTLSYSLTQEGSTFSSGTGIINNQDPLFVDATNNNFNLLACSPAIDAANNAAIDDITTDLANDIRIANSIIDMGVYENQNPNLGTGIIYVSQNVAGGNQDGTSWANAYNNLQTALDNYLSDCTTAIWVAQGLYLPSKDNPATLSTDTRDVTFYINTDGIKIYGGFSGNGTESSLEERDIDAYPTILSGDIGTTGNVADNTFHVLYLDGTSATENITNATILDGLRIQNGNASSGDGGGIYINGSGENNECSPSIVNCTFSNNAASLGGAIFNNAQNIGTASMQVSNCTFIDNSASGGGGLYNDSNNSGTAVPSFTACVFANNAASLGGGGVRNNATDGGTARIIAKNCLFANNTASLNGGGIYSFEIDFGNANSVLTNCTFYNNSSNNGGALYNIVASPTATNCIFWKNKQNNASNVAGADISESSGSSTNISYSLTQANSTYNNGTGIINNQDPLFVDAANEDFRLQRCSPVINVGDNNAIGGTMTDLIDSIRIVNGTIDMGAYESQSTNLNIDIIYVNQNVVGGNQDGTSWTNAIPDLQTALDLFQSCNIDEIWVAQGAYKPSKDNPASDDNSSRDVTFYINTDGIKIYGGFSGNGTETMRTERDAGLYPTIISGDIGTIGFKNDNAYHVFFIDGTSINGSITNTTILDGLRIRDGYANVNNFSNRTDNGAGIYVFSEIENECSPTISNCTFSENTALRGGAIYNLALDGGIANMNLNHCTFSNNSSNIGGGAILNEANIGGIASPTIVSCAFINNTSSSNGGGIYNESADGSNSSPTIINCIFDGNTAPNGGAIYNNATLSTISPSVINCTFYNNLANNKGGGIYNANTATQASISNCIFWENKQSNSNNIAGADISENDGSTSSVSYSLTQENSTYSSGTGIINNEDPLFVDTASGNLSLQNCSPVINLGDNSNISDTSTDIDGSPRIINSTVDMGAIEFQELSDIIAISTILASDSLFSNVDTIQTFETVEIIENDTIIFEAAKAVILQAGFHALAGSDFTARIVDCNETTENLQEDNEIEEKGVDSKPEIVVVEQMKSTQKVNLTAYPNPFKETTTIEFELSAGSDVRLSIFNLQGKELKRLYDGTSLNKGKHQIRLDVDWNAGIYLVRLQTEQRIRTHKLLLQK